MSRSKGIRGRTKTHAAITNKNNWMERFVGVKVACSRRNVQFVWLRSRNEGRDEGKTVGWFDSVKAAARGDRSLM